MDDSFQFIIESPQSAQGHKKRPRLVTSCDNCRLKKIKCLQPTPDSKCEACRVAKIQCRFRDRERYFAERSRAIAGPGASSGYTSSEQRSDSSADTFSVASSSSSPALSSYSISRSAPHSPKASGIVGADDNGGIRYSPYAPDPRRSLDYPHRHGHSSSVSYNASPRQSPLGYTMSPSPSPMAYHSRSHSHPNARQVQLFDSSSPQHPAYGLMTEFIVLFFNHFHQEFSFISYDDVYRDFTQRRMAAPLANCIAAFASSFSANPDLTGQGLQSVTEMYANSAKTAVNLVSHIPSVDTLHALILLAWYEYKANRASSFRDYAALSARMSTQLGYNSASSSREGDRKKETMKALYNLQMVAAQYHH
ncbi:hypothetical protein BDP27DRAFT_1220037 [Rhodocollybia butyracea]|uniref:Zn(2)-C6 fungal-type domain-containing protein n=1 Tax=Rhodocollybia butyracea TaxID=206335 RepID=A0A9P5PXF1_9AGAR|nr:hypothetical protein BDP27DRAFT_1220037 [Rhodocollybia butyracea]